MKLHFQSELDNLTDETIKAMSDYTEGTFSEKFFYKVSDEFENLRNDDDRIGFLEDLAIDLKLKQFNLTDIQEIIIAYMFINDLFGRSYTYKVMKMLDNVLL